MNSWLTHNLGLKILSVILAALVWILINAKISENPNQFPPTRKFHTQPSPQ